MQACTNKSRRFSTNERRRKRESEKRDGWIYYCNMKRKCWPLVTENETESRYEDELGKSLHAYWHYAQLFCLHWKRRTSATVHVFGQCCVLCAQYAAHKSNVWCSFSVLKGHYVTKLHIGTLGRQIVAETERNLSAYAILWLKVAAIPSVPVIKVSVTLNKGNLSSMSAYHFILCLSPNKRQK